MDMYIIIIIFLFLVFHHFLVEVVGRDLIIPCPLAGTNITTVGATIDDGLILVPDREYRNESELMIPFRPVLDSNHAQTFSCHGYEANGTKVYFNFTIVAIG